MRLTAVVRMPMLYRRMKDLSWKKWRKPGIVDLGMEKKLRDEGVDVIDANQFVREMDRNLYPTDWRTLPDMKPVFPQPPAPNSRDHPDWHDKPVMVFEQESFPMEGVNQAQAFTKSVQIKDGLPDSLLGSCNFTKLQNPEYAAERIVKQAFLWDAYTEKLPNLKNFDFPTRVFRRPMGIPAKRSNEILMRNLLRLIEQDNSSEAFSKMISNDQEFRVNLTRHGSNIQIRLSPLMNIMSKRPLSPFLESGESTADDHKIPNIYPFLSTANFSNQNIYKEGDFFSVSANSAFPHIHTAIFSHHIPGSHTHIHPRWNDDRYSGATIMYAFSTALLEARRKFGDISSTLPEPVTSQVVHLTGKEFQFAVFQLNTLDLDNDSSKIKNIVWLTDKINLFSHIENKLGTELFEGYNPEPFKILKGLYSSPTM